jgi:hypothetical protein
LPPRGSASLPTERTPRPSISRPPQRVSSRRYCGQPFDQGVAIGQATTQGEETCDSSR